MMTPASQLVVIIPTRNRRTDLHDCLVSLARQTRPPDLTIIVDSSTTMIGDEASWYAAAAAPLCTAYYRASRTGAASQRNQALACVPPAAACVALLDDDVVLEPTYLAVLEQALERDAGLAAVSGWITNPQVAPNENRTMPLLRLFGHYGTQPGQLLASGFNTPHWVNAPATLFPTETVEGGNALVRRSAIDGAWFDPGYERFSGYAYAEDLDFAQALRQVGRLAVHPDARMLHRASAAGRVDDLRMGLAQVVNRARYLKRHSARTPAIWLAYAWAMCGLALANSAQIARGRSLRRLIGNIAGFAIVISIRWTC